MKFYAGRKDESRGANGAILLPIRICLPPRILVCFKESALLTGGAGPMVGIELLAGTIRENVLRGLPGRTRSSVRICRWHDDAGG